MYYISSDFLCPFWFSALDFRLKSITWHFDRADVWHFHLCHFFARKEWECPHQWDENESKVHSFFYRKRINFLRHLKHIAFTVFCLVYFQNQDISFNVQVNDFLQYVSEWNRTENTMKPNVLNLLFSRILKCYHSQVYHIKNCNILIIKYCLDTKLWINQTYSIDSTFFLIWLL